MNLLISKSGKVFETINPANGKVICEVQEGDKADIDKAVAAAKKAFKRGSTWRQMNASSRGELLLKLAALIERDAVQLTSLETIDNGMPFTQAWMLGVLGSVKMLHYFSGMADKNRRSDNPGRREFLLLHPTRTRRGCRVDHPLEWSIVHGCC